MSDELVNAALVPIDDVAGTSLEQYAGRSEVRELAVRLMRLHPAAKEVGDAGMLAVAQLALMVGANPLPGTNEIHVWFNKSTQTPQIQLGINYDRRKAREHGGIAWQEQPRPMTDEEAEAYGVASHELGAICSGCRRDDLMEMVRAGFPHPDVFRMVGAVGYATVAKADRKKKGRTLNWTAEKRAEADILRKLFPNLESTSGAEPWREQIAVLTDEPELTQEEAKAQLARGVKLLRGDHDEDDPFGMDEPKAIIRTIEEPEPVEVDVIDVDAETGELLDGMRVVDHPTDGQLIEHVEDGYATLVDAKTGKLVDEGPVTPQHPMRQQEEVPPEEGDLVLASVDADPDENDHKDHGPSPLQLEMAGDLVKRLDHATRAEFFGDPEGLLDCIRVESGDPDITWPAEDDAAGWKNLYTIALKYAHANA